MRPRVHSWQCRWAGLWGARSLASEGSLLVSAQGWQWEGVTVRFLMDMTPPSPMHLFLLHAHPGLPAYGGMQWEFPSCKTSHPFTSPKEAKAAKISELKWKDCCIGSQHKIRSAPSSSTGGPDPVLQNAVFFTYGHQTVPVVVYLVWKLYRTQSASHHVCETPSTTGTWSLLKPWGVTVTQIINNNTVSKRTYIFIWKCNDAKHLWLTAVLSTLRVAGLHYICSHGFMYKM